ncbi:MAG: hypothetical protein OEM62_07190 [Acidobacteriota bacterium]|nr:hypothetical protein [Acidobacteriota bacterium]
MTAVATALSMLAGASSVAAIAESGNADGRGHEILMYTCSSAFGGSELTLFGNGTLRLRERDGADGVSELSLVELTEEELAAYVARLRTKPYDRRPESLRGGPSGEFVEQCRLEVDAGPDESMTYRFSRVESMSLDLSQLVRVAEELVEEVKLRRRGMRFPRGYEPSPGDVLLGRNGTRYRIERFTADGKGLEISGIDEPIVLYIETSAVIGEFLGLVEDPAMR